MPESKTSRRTFLSWSLALAATPTLAACDSSADKKFPADVTVPSNRQSSPKPFTATRTVSVTQHGASTSSKDNSAAFAQALNAAGRNGEVTVPAGEFALAQPVSWPGFPVRLRGLGTAAKPTRLNIAASAANGISVNGAAAGGSHLENVTLTGSTGSQVSIHGVSNGQFVITRCSFLNAPTYAVQVQDAFLYIEGSNFHGPADGTMSAVHAVGSTTRVTAKNCLITGCFRGLYCAGVKDVSAQNVTVDAMWWCANGTKNSTTLASAQPNSVTVKDAPKLPQSTGYTVTAWQKLATDATLTPVAGKPGWFTLTNVTGVEPRLMLRTTDTWATVLEASGNQVHLHTFYDWSSCHPKAAPTSTLSGVTVERPFIASVQSMSGTQGTLLDRWKAGSKAATQTPPTGARVTIAPVFDYQIFGTDGTQSFSATDCTVRNSWADSISTIASSNAYVARNDIWDSQDVGVTIQQGTGACRVEKNTMHRIGTAAVFIGTSKAQVTGNTIYGAQHTSFKEDSYAALQVEGAEKVAVWKNTVAWGGSPYEVRAMIIEGRRGPLPQDPSKGPFATGGFYKENKFTGYPSQLSIPAPSSEPSLKMAEVTVRGHHASAAIGQWGNIRIQALDGADKGSITPSTK